MKELIDIILESRGQRISQRANNRPYDVNDDELVHNKASRPARAQKLRETKLDTQVQEFCSELVNDFIVKFYKLTSSDKFIEFNENIVSLLKDEDLDDKITPSIDKWDGGCRCLSYYHWTDYWDYHRYMILKFNDNDSFTKILNNLEFTYLTYRSNGPEDSNRKESTGILNIDYNTKFFASVLHKLRRHDLAKKAEQGSRSFNLQELFNDLPDKYNKNYFADKFEEFEKAYNEILANW